MRFSNASARNFGFGKKINFAAKNALNERYGGGHFSTVATHVERFSKFEKYLKENKIKDLKKVELHHLKNFAKDLKEKVNSGEMKTAYAQNLISSANVTMNAIRADSKISIAPSAAVGQRDNIRTTAPRSLNETRFQHFIKNASERAAAVMNSAREFGLRFREGVMMNYREAHKEAKQTGFVTIREGTKGGRGKSAAVASIRKVEISPRAMRVLEKNAQLQGERNNLIREGESYKEVNNKLHGSTEREAFKAADLAGYHDARAAFACERYEQKTTFSAPCVIGSRQASKAEDRAARREILTELGHGSARELTAYIGSAA